MKYDFFSLYKLFKQYANFKYILYQPISYVKENTNKSSLLSKKNILLINLNYCRYTFINNCYKKLSCIIIYNWMAE